MSSLYEITAEAMQIEDLLTESAGELTPELEARLDAMLAGGREKLEAAARVVKSLETSADACELEAIRLTARRQMFQKNAAALKARMLAAVDTAFHGKLKTPLFTIWGQTSGDTVSFNLAPDADLSRLDKAYVRTTYALDRQLLLDHYKTNKSIPAEINVQENPGTRFLRIK